MSVLMIDYDYQQSKKIFPEINVSFPVKNEMNGLCIVIPEDIYKQLDEMIFQNRLPYLSSNEFKQKIIYIIPFSCNKIKKTICFQCSNNLIEFMNEILNQCYQNFPHNYNIILQLDLKNENFGRWCKSISKYFSYPVLDGISKNVKFFRENTLEDSLPTNDTLYLVQKVLEDYEQMIDEKENILECEISVKFDLDTINELKKLNTKVFESENKFTGLEISDKFIIKDITKTRENQTLLTLTLNEKGNGKLGDKDSVDVVYSKYTYHTHPKKTYDKFEVELAWPSADDFISFIILFLDNITIFHVTCTMEGAYITTINPDFMPYLYDYSDDDYTNICEKYYNFKYPSRNDRLNKGVMMTVNEFLETIKRKINIKGKELPPIFNVEFVMWKEFTDKKIFTVSFYSNENQSCQITDIQNIK